MNSIAGLTGSIPGARLIGDGQLPVTGVTHIAANAKPGCIYVAIRGFTHNGEDFIGEAAAGGAAAVVAERDAGPVGCSRIVVGDARRALSRLSAELYGHPSRQLTVIGVTGTNGKTTTTLMIDSILRCAGYRTGVVGTAGVRIGDRLLSAERTTPEAPDFHRYLREMVECGTDAAIVEVSAQALTLNRVADCQFAVAVFTNLSPEHLNFYGSVENYLGAKIRLFSSLSADRGAVACINGDDPSHGAVVAGCAVPAVLFGGRRSCGLRVDQIQQLGSGQMCEVSERDMRFPVRTFLPGVFNLYNAVAAASAARALGIDPRFITEGIAAVRHVSGRYRVLRAGGRTVWVDFAHNPEALRNILITARRCGGDRRLILVVGCEGGTDVAKRVRTGIVAGQYADQVIITSDNVYHDDPETVIDHIAAGLEQAGRSEGVHFQRRADRYEAISQALEMADHGSVVVVAGKGAEQYWVVGDRYIPFNDEEVCRSLLAAKAELHV